MVQGIVNKSYLVEYDSNNSGGGWWLDDGDWLELEKAGWKVDWKKDDEYFQKQWGSRTDGRWLGALATSASINVEAPDGDTAEYIAIRAWEGVTGQSADSHGCYCCGQPHYFSAGEVRDDEQEVP